MEPIHKDNAVFTSCEMTNMNDAVICDVTMGASRASKDLSHPHSFESCSSIPMSLSTNLCSCNGCRVTRRIVSHSYMVKQYLTELNHQQQYLLWRASQESHKPRQAPIQSAVDWQQLPDVYQSMRQINVQILFIRTRDTVSQTCLFSICFFHFLAVSKASLTLSYCKELQSSYCCFTCCLMDRS